MFVRSSLFALLALSGTAAADTMYWTGAVNQFWGNPGNWAGGVVPSSNDFAVIQPGTTATVTGFTVIQTLFVQPGASMLIQSQMQVRGGASIQGTMSIVGAPASFTHTNDVALYGTVQVWGGGQIARSLNGFGTFTVYDGGVLAFPNYDTLGGSLGTGLSVQGLLSIDTTGTVIMGSYSANNPLSYIGIEPSGTMSITHGADFARSTSSGQLGQYIANAGYIHITGAYSDAVNIGAGVGLLNTSTLVIERPDLHIATSLDLSGTDTLARGTWSCRDFGRIFFDGKTVTAIEPQATVQLWGNGSSIPSMNALNEVNGRLFLQNGVAANFAPQGGGLSNHGVVVIDDRSSLSVNGLYYNRTEGLLDMGIYRDAQGSHAMIYATNVALAGHLAARFSQPFVGAMGDTIPLLRAENFLSGQFDDVTIIGSGVPLQTTYNLAEASLVAGCAADFNGDGFLDFFDYDEFVQCFETGFCPGDRSADFNGDSFIDFFDYDDYVTAFELGC